MCQDFSDGAHRLLELIQRDGIVALKAFHGGVAGDSHDHPIRDSSSSGVGDKTVPQIVKPEVLNFGALASDSEGSSHLPESGTFESEYVVANPRELVEDFPQDRADGNLPSLPSLCSLAY